MLGHWSVATYRTFTQLQYVNHGKKLSKAALYRMSAPNVHVMGPMKGDINTAWHVEKEISV